MSATKDRLMDICEFVRSLGFFREIEDRNEFHA